MPFKSSQKAFTLIELLISISIIAILAGILISVLNPEALRNRAKDGIRAGNVAKLSQAVEGFNAAEGHYPNVTADSGTYCSPACTTDQQILTKSNYVQNWPIDSTYVYGYSTTYSIGCISVPMATSISPPKYFKYVTGYNVSMAGSSTMVGKVLKSCDNSCTGAPNLSLASCVII